MTRLSGVEGAMLAIAAVVMGVDATRAFVIPNARTHAKHEFHELMAHEEYQTDAYRESAFAQTLHTPNQSASVPFLGLTVFGLCTIALQQSKRGKLNKVMRHFSGGETGGGARSFDPANELGVQDPVGFWDPLGLAADKDEATFKRRRTVEIKHGRICMYATIGYIVPEYFKFPGYLSPSNDLKFADVPNGLAALSKLPVLGGAQIVAFAGIIETTGFFSGSTTDGRGPRALGQMKDSTEEAEPGNYGIGFPNFIGKVEDPEERKSKLAAELANGRLAMVAIIGMFFQDGLTGSAWGDWALYTASPLRAADAEAAPAPPKWSKESELGAMAPLGFWDPLGFCENEEKFKDLRAKELKHGRLAMMGAVGMLVQSIVQVPGMEGVPKSVAAITTGNGMVGGVAIFAIIGVLEAAVFVQDPNKEPGNFGNPLPLVGDDYSLEMRAKELNNGRMAMGSALVIIVNSLLTGKDALQQFGL